MKSILTILTDSKLALVLISLIVVLTIVDSRFINISYGTNLGTPSNLHLLLFVSSVIVASIINIILLLFVRSNDSQAKASRPLLFRVAYIGTSAIQYAILLVLLVVISEILIFRQYSALFSLLIVYLSHLWSAIMLGVLSFTFIQWYRITRSFSIAIYGVVFILILFLLLPTLPLLTEQFINQPQSVYPVDYITLIDAIKVPSPDIAFIYGLGNYVLPMMIISSWILTVSLLKSYTEKIGKKTFWIIVSIPLLYQLFTFVVKDANIATYPILVQIIYTRQFQFILGISYQISGLFFAIAYFSIARKMKRRVMKNYLIISSIAIISLFSSMQPGLPFYSAYPPFGIVTLLFMGLSSYLLLVGILGCAAYVSRDSELRREVHKGLEIDSDMLKMGTAEMQREVERKVRTVIDRVELSDEMRNRVDPDEEDVKLMIDEVLNEIHSKKSHVKLDKQ